MKIIASLNFKEGGNCWMTELYKFNAFGFEQGKRYAVVWEER
jgi:hypothetical protein